MSVSMNVHPASHTKGWNVVQFEDNGYRGGNCIVLQLGSESHARICIHYGALENRNEFVRKLKESLDAIPNWTDWGAPGYEPEAVKESV